MSVLLDPSPTAQARAHPNRRPEIDGLRALAVALVVGYHVGTGRVSGGVDVFLALSGFFLVHSLVGQVERSGGVRPLTSIARTLSRLVPPAVLVLAGTVAASALVLPETRWRELARHLLASATFTENQHLVAESVDYAASNAIASPVQQFWSLSIQVQVLLVTPAVVAAGALILRGPRRRFARPAAVLAVAVVTTASFAWSVVATRADQQVAYFSTLPRLWELGAGALVALVLGGVWPGRRTGVLLGWGAVVALVACGAVLDGAHTFPGWQAAWPVACALVLLVVADSGGRHGVHRFLGLRPLRWLGNRSYALYLWHWPVLVLHLVHTGRDAPSVKGAGAVVLLSRPGRGDAPPGRAARVPAAPEPAPRPRAGPGGGRDGAAAGPGRGHQRLDRPRGRPRRGGGRRPGLPGRGGPLRPRRGHRGDPRGRASAVPVGDPGRPPLHARRRVHRGRRPARRRTDADRDLLPRVRRPRAPGRHRG